MEKDKYTIQIPEKLKDNAMAYELSILPQEINRLHLEVAKKDGEIAETKMKINMEEDKLKKQVYFDETLTNKDRRESALNQKIIESIEIIELKEKLREQLCKKDELDIELKFMYNKFTAIKYLVRMLETLVQ